jgi:cytochrome P450
MTRLADLELPTFELAASGGTGTEYHARLAQLRQRGWLARSEIAVLVLDRAAADAFLRSRQTAFPGRQIASLFGIDSGPLFEHIDANLLNLSGERHHRLRRIVMPAFSPAAASRWRPVMRDLLDQLWTGLDGATEADLVDVLARPYPSLTVAAVLGAPAADAPRLHDWSERVQRQFDLLALSTQLADIEDAASGVYAYIDALLDDRSAAASGDLIGMLLAAESEGDRLSHDEVVNLAVNVLAGGIETTQSALSHALHLFALHPEQWRLLATSPELVPQAVQEVLRVEPVTPFTARLCLEDIEHRDVTFPAGTIVAICVERANREDEGEVFDITASRERRSLSFGAGAHFCLGANLATAELEEAIAFLAPRLSELALAGEPSFGGLDGIYGVRSLPLRWRGGGGASVG